MKQKNARIINMGSSKNFYRNNSQFVKLMFANALGRFGDSIDMVAFSWLTYQITNSVVWSAVVVGVNQLVSVLFQPFIGSVVESLHKKKGDGLCRYYSLLSYPRIFYYVPHGKG